MKGPWPRRSSCGAWEAARRDATRLRPPPGPAWRRLFPPPAWSSTFSPSASRPSTCLHRHPLTSRPTPLKLVLAFLAIYVIWGSTYLAIRYAVEGLPPFAMASGRFLVAGGLMYVWARMAGRRAPAGPEWRVAWISGALMLLGGNGAVVWAEQWVASGTAALLVSSVPLWMVLIDWSRGGDRPGRRIQAGLLLGFIGVFLLFGSPEMREQQQLLGGVVLLGGSFCWAAGSLHTRRWSSNLDPYMAAAIQMIAGGVCLGGASLLAREQVGPELLHAPVLAWASLAYLIFMGAIVGYSAYLWLLRVSTPARVSTYAYVNPVVAVILGALFADEIITTGGLLAAAVIVGAVALILTGSSRPGPRSVGADA